MELPKNIKLIPIILAAVGMLIGSVYFVEDRYFKVEAAKEMRVQIEKASVDTFQKQQQLMDSKQEKQDLELLDLWRENQRDTERMLENDPNNIYLKNKLERIKTKIKRLEDKLYSS